MPVSFILKKSVLPPPDPKVYSTPFVDTFDGVDGELPSCENWNAVVGTLSSTTPAGEFNRCCMIYNNTFYTQMVDTGPNKKTSLYLNHYVKGDFDIRVYQTTVGVNIGTGEGANKNLFVRIDGSHYVRFYHAYGSSGWQERYLYYNTGTGQEGVSNTIMGNGWYRVVRVGTLWTAYFSSDGNSWTALQSNLNIGDGDITDIRLETSTTSADITVAYNDFTIQSADEVVSKAGFAYVRPTAPYIQSDIGTTITKTYRTRFVASQIGNTNGTTGKSKVQFKGMNAGTSMTITGAYIGKASTSGSLWNFDSTPIQMTFDGGSSTVQIPNNGIVTSDEINYNVNGSEDIVISFTVSYVSADNMFVSEGQYGLITTGGGSWDMNGSYAGDTTIASMAEFKNLGNWRIPIIAGVLSSTL